MSKKIQLSIPAPCHEDWNTMTPVEKGKFCGSCQKQVVDFSNMSDRQVAEFFKKPSKGSVCGRFMTDQLDREIGIPRKRIPWIKYFFTIALPAFFVSVKATASRAQGKIKVNEVSADTTRPRIYDDVRVLGMVSRPQQIRPFVGDTVITPAREPVVIQPVPVCSEPVIGKPSFENIKGEVNTKIVKEKKQIRGIVIDESSNPVPGASVIIKGTRTGVATDFNGNFKLPAAHGDLLVITGGIEPIEIEADANNFMTIATKRIIITGGEVVVSIAGMISVKRANKKSTIAPVLPALVKDIIPDALSIFPNPVSAGSGINLVWKHNEEGYYTVQLLNPAGQAVQQREIWIDADARLLNFEIPFVPAGSYFLVITNNKTGKRFTEKLIVQ